MNVLECFLLSLHCSEMVSLQAVLFENRFSEGPLMCLQRPVADKGRAIKGLVKMKFVRPLPIVTTCVSYVRTAVTIALRKLSAVCTS